MSSLRNNLRALLFPLSKGTRARAVDREDNPDLQAIWDIVARIPRGSATTYGDVARAAGLPGRARLVGNALKHMPPGSSLPWHRVVGAGGKIVFPARSSPHREQTRLLRSEHIEVTNGRVARSAMTTLDDLR
jgi:methylated-DNA-protein-cysteine methyltransferase-like protein